MNRVVLPLVCFISNPAQLWTEINHLRSKKFRVCVQLQYEQENVFSASDSANAAAADRAGVAEFEKLPSKAPQSNPVLSKIHK